MKARYCWILFLFWVIFPVLLFAGQSSLQGKVIDRQTRLPLSKANVEILRTTIGSTTDEQGNFLLKHIPPGKYLLKVSYMGYKPEQKSISLSDEQTLTLNFALEVTPLKGQRINVIEQAEVNQAVRRESPLAFTKISMEEVAENYTTGDVPELIQDVPGVWIASAGLGESHISIRGSAANKIHFLLNDIPMNDPEEQWVRWSDWSGLAFITQAIEVQRGPGFLLYGANNFGGAVHIKTMGVSPDPENKFRFSVGYYDRMGIQTGPNAGKMFDAQTGELVETLQNLVNYTYSARFNSGPKLNGKLNSSLFFEYKKGDSYLENTTYDGFTMGVDAETMLKNQQLWFCWKPPNQTCEWPFSGVHPLRGCYANGFQLA